MDFDKSLVWIGNLANKYVKDLNVFELSSEMDRFKSQVNAFMIIYEMAAQIYSN